MPAEPVTIPAGAVPIDPSILGDGVPVDELLYYDGPLIYTTLRWSDLLLWYCWNLDDTRDYHLVVPTDAATIAALKAGSLDTRTAILAPGRGWLVGFSRTGGEDWAWELAEIPEYPLPEPGAFLPWPEREGTAD